MSSHIGGPGFDPLAPCKRERKEGGSSNQRKRREEGKVGRRREERGGEKGKD